jgi:hypothetical protein
MVLTYLDQGGVALSKTPVARSLFVSAQDRSFAPVGYRSILLPAAALHAK